MELPALLIFPLLAILGPREKDILSLILIGLWSLHYINRTIIFPFRLKTKGKKIPLTIVTSALFFNLINGFVNGYYLGFEAPADSSYLQIQVLIGLAIFFAGMFINIRTDNRLIALRNKGNGYKIPRGWLFEYISCPNHFGEVIEWIGFAIVAWNLPALSFAVWTVSNLVPRALNHHEWYKEKFDDYPRSEKLYCRIYGSQIPIVSHKFSSWSY